MITAVIMASGLSNRYGSNKLLLSFKGKYLIEHVLDLVLQSPSFYPILVANDELVMELGNTRGIKVIHNKDAVKGQSESIKLGIKNSPEVDGYAFFTGDQPLLDIDTIELLVENFKQNQNLIIVPSYKGKSGLPVLFPQKYKNDLLELTGDIGGKAIIKKNFEMVNYVEVRDETILWDIDTKEDFIKFLSKG